MTSIINIIKAVILLHKCCKNVIFNKAFVLRVCSTTADVDKTRLVDLK